MITFSQEKGEIRKAQEHIVSCGFVTLLNLKQITPITDLLLKLMAIESQAIESSPHNS
jgi:hypothetical protein